MKTEKGTDEYRTVQNLISKFKYETLNDLIFFRNDAIDHSRKTESFKLELSDKSHKEDAYDPYLERTHVEHPLT